MTQPQPLCTPPTAHHLGSEQYLALSLSAGTELFCASGTIQLQTAPIAAIEAAPSGLYLQLRHGQSWRAPAHMHLQACAIQGPARLQCQAPPTTTLAVTKPRSSYRRADAPLRALQRWLITLQPK